jgi:hypothetical protein
VKPSVFLLLLAIASPANPPPAGTLISAKASVRISSTSEYDTPETHLDLVRGPETDCAFHTRSEKSPWVILKLPQPATITALRIVNRKDGNTARAAGLTAWLSTDGKSWTEVWKASGPAEPVWDIPLSNTPASGIRASFVKIGLSSDQPQFLHLSRISVYGL